MLDEPLLARIVQRTSWTTTTWRSSSGAVRDYTPLNTNQLLPGGTSAYPGAYGVKTGTTDRAKENLVSAARVSFADIIAVVLGSDDTRRPATATPTAARSSTGAWSRPAGSHARSSYG